MLSFETEISMFTLPLINVIPIFRPPEQFGTAMQVFTGNADQIDRYRQNALRLQVSIFMAVGEPMSRLREL